MKRIQTAQRARRSRKLMIRGALVVLAFASLAAVIFNQYVGG